MDNLLNDQNILDELCSFDLNIAEEEDLDDIPPFCRISQTFTNDVIFANTQDRDIQKQGGELFDYVNIACDQSIKDRSETSGQNKFQQVQQALGNIDLTNVEYVQPDDATSIVSFALSLLGTEKAQELLEENRKLAACPLSPSGSNVEVQEMAISNVPNDNDDIDKYVYNGIRYSPWVHPAMSLKCITKANAMRLLSIMLTIIYTIEEKYENLQKILSEQRDELIKVINLCRQILSKVNDVDMPNNASGYFYGMPFFRTKYNFSCTKNSVALSMKSKRLFNFCDIQEIHSWTTKDINTLKLRVGTDIVNHRINQIKDEIKVISDTLSIIGKDAKRFEELQNQEDKLTKEILELEFEDATDSEFILSILDYCSDLKINWLDIEYNVFNQRHSAYDCEFKWETQIHPNMKQKGWTKEENEKLIAVVKEYKYQQWDLIANEFSDRSALQCIQRYQSNLDNRIRQGRWSKKEDEKLRETVKRCTIGNYISWNDVSSYYEDRTKNQLYLRYMNSLLPQQKIGKFTVEEDNKILAALQKYGTDFKKLPPHIVQGRTITQLKNRYTGVLKIRDTRSALWTIEQDQLMLQLTEKYGKDWAKIADYFEGRDRTSCRHRFSVLNKWIKKHPNRPISECPRKKTQPHNTTDAEHGNAVDSDAVEDVLSVVSQRTQRALTRETFKNKPIKKTNTAASEKIESKKQKVYKIDKELQEYFQSVAPIKHTQPLVKQDVQDLCKMSLNIIKLFNVFIDIDKVDTTSFNTQESQVWNRLRGDYYEQLTKSYNPTNKCINVTPTCKIFIGFNKVLNSVMKPSIPYKKLKNKYEQIWSEETKKRAEEFQQIYNSLIEYPLIIAMTKSPKI